MGFFDDFGKKVADAGQKTVQKTKEISDIARVNSLINQEESKINNVYCQIGQLYVNMHGNDGEAEFSGMVKMVAELEQNVREYRKQIQDIKGVQHCEKCGAEVPRGVAFCSSCGNSMPKTETQVNAEDCIKCTNCGNVVKRGMRFCTSCGKPLVPVEVATERSQIPDVAATAEKHCPHCGAKQTDDSVFCTECGQKL